MNKSVAIILSFCMVFCLQPMSYANSGSRLKKTEKGPYRIKKKSSNQKSVASKNYRAAATSASAQYYQNQQQQDDELMQMFMLMMGMSMISQFAGGALGGGGKSLTGSSLFGGNIATGEPAGYSPLQNTGRCENVYFDCANAEMTINGQKRPIACGPQTGRGKSKTSFTFSSIGRGSGGKLKDGSPGLGRDKEKIVTSPLICGNCVIHVGAVGKGAVSKGCLHVTQADFNVLKGCIGKKFSMNSKSEPRNRALASAEKKKTSTKAQ